MFLKVVLILCTQSNPEYPPVKSVEPHIQLMVGIFMISFLYRDHTYYANVINYAHTPLTYYISIITSSPLLPKKLLLHLGNDGFELSVYSPGIATKELINAIALKLPGELKADVV